MRNFQSASLELPEFCNLIQEVEFDSSLSLEEKQINHWIKPCIPKQKQAILEKLRWPHSYFRTGQDKNEHSFELIQKKDGFSSTFIHVQ